MLTMGKVHGIRYRYFAEGEKISHIARTLGFHFLNCKSRAVM